MLIDLLYDSTANFRKVNNTETPSSNSTSREYRLNLICAWFVIA